MKFIRNFGSFVFVLGLFVSIFGGIPWYIIACEDPVNPLWLRIAIFSLIGGILIVLISLALEQKKKLDLDKKIEENGNDNDIILINSTEIPDRNINEVLGLVQGHTVFAIWVGKDLSAIVRLILGGELTEYTEMMANARSIATLRMTKNAKKIGADAIINVRYMTTSVVGSAAELLVYGTAVKLSK